jgi:putative ABC transport system substrate-binding protein
VRRRRLLALLGAGALLPGAGLVAPRVTLAQAEALKTVAVLFPGDSDEDEKLAAPFFETLARFGWVEGRNIAYERHSGRGTRQYLETMASNAAGSAPDLIFATTGALAGAVVKEAGTIPVVFITMRDPAASGLVRSLARPGSNATGVYQRPGDAAARRYALVKQVVPALKRLGAVFDRNSPDVAERRAAHEKAAKAAGLELVPAEFTNVEAIARLFANFRRDGITVAEITPSFSLTARRREIAGLATVNNLALVGHRAEWADAGAILTYGVDVAENYRRAAAIAQRILNGAKPANLAVELPSHRELVVNPRAAHAVGLAIPKALLQQANRVVA